ncbi:hypothetical protein J4E89_006222 [Alternaria sp. Ai002NY15]|nr:hypothetical protein J4E89_006222 [Alternaria sp. Ai002NY15]
MPSLKDLNCAIELSGSQQALREFGTIYGDGFVETFVPVPNKPQSFSIHLTSNKFIAPGVAIFVYVDGVYQCNRNRQDLKLRKPSDSRSLVDFRVRQKEERQKDGSMIAREWAFDKLNIASADDAPNICSPNVLDNIGCIEVVVLRCAGTRNAKSASTMNFDGAGDFPDHRFGVDDSSSPSNERSMYDDRGPFFNSFGNGHGPPPPLPSYRSPYAETQGVEESRRIDTQSEGQPKYKETHSDAKSASQPPGAWPESPFDAPKEPYQHIEQPAFSSRNPQSEHGSNWAKSQPGWGDRPSRSRAGTHVTWNAEHALETDSSSVDGWNAREDTPSDAWDTGDTWPTDKAAEWDASSQQGKLWVTNPPSHYHLRSGSPVTLPKHDRRRSKHEAKRSSRSKSRSTRSRRDREVTSSEEDSGSWDRLERPSDSVVSLSSSDATLQPSRSRSRVQPSRQRSKSRSRRAKSVQREHERKPSKHSNRHPSSRPVDEVPAAGPVPSIITRMTPTVMNAPPSIPPEQVRSRQPSAYTGPPASATPAPEWGAAVHEAMGKPSNVPSNMFPAPYASSMKDFVQSTAGEKLGGNRPPSLASWGNDKNNYTDKPSWGKATEKNLGWGKDTENGWQEKNLKENDKKGWYSTDEDQTAGWNDTDGNKKIQADSDWNRKDNDWGNPPSSPKQERVDKMNDWAGLRSALTSAFNNPPAPVPAPEVPWQNQSWSFPADNAVKPALQQPTPTPFASAPAPPAPAPEKGRLPSQRMSNKTLSRYRPNHNFPSRIHPKPTPNFTAQPHWQFPPPPSSSTPKNVLHASSPNDTYIAPAEPRLTISKSTSSKSGIEYAVRAGKATEYGHVVGRPEYLDRLEKPYAVFRFKYRSEGVLKGLGVLGEGDMDVARDGEKQEAEKLKGIPQEELIAKMLALERKLKGKDAGEGTSVAGDGGKERKHSKKSIDKEKQKSKQRRHSEKTEAHGNGRVKDFTEQWVERHSRDPSTKAKSAVAKEVGWEGDKERKEKEKELAGTWGQDANEGWGGGDVKW